MFMHRRHAFPNAEPPFELVTTTKNVKESGLAVAWVADEDVVHGHADRVPRKRDASKACCATGDLPKSRLLSQAGSRVISSLR